MWQVVIANGLDHPEWDAGDHYGGLQRAGFDPSVMADPLATVGMWIDQDLARLRPS